MPTEVARTIVALVTHGALATVGEDGVPLGTYASYVLDGEGQPILRLRRDAVHTANLLRDPRCSLFVQPEDMPARLLARAPPSSARWAPVLVWAAHRRTCMHACMPAS